MVIPQHIWISSIKFYTNKKHKHTHTLTKKTQDRPFLEENPREFWFVFLHILNGRMATLPQALPRSFRDLHFCFRESKFKTAASASFRGVDFCRIFLEVLPRSHGELPRKLHLGVAWKCVICILGWVNMGELVNHFSWSYLPYRWARRLSVPPRARFASAKLPRSFRKEYEHVYQKHTKTVASLCLPRPCKTITSYKAQYMSIYDIFIYVAHKTCKRHNDKFLQNALPRSFHIKTCEYCFRELPRLRYGESFWLICPNPA